MKKSQKKSASKRKQRPESAEDRNLYDLGLEPPKIYRESRQQSDLYDKTNRGQRTKRSSKNSRQNLTRAEKRQKDNKKRKKRNTFRKVMIWLAVIISFVAVGTVLSLTVFFHIDTINISGNKIYDKDEILAQCTIDKGENLFLSDTDTAKQMLEQNLPYIYNAEITRELPYTIEIKITEATPAYSIKNKDKTFILLDDNFKVLENKAKKAKGISISKADIENAVPGRTIAFKNKDIGKCLTQLSQVVKENKFDEITSIYSNNISDNYVVYDKRIEFRLGTCDELENKIYQGLTACEKLNQSNPNAKGVMTITGGKSLYFTEK